MRTATSMLCWLSLSLWFAAALTAGGAAFGVFATMPELQISLANYGHVPPEDQARLAAGLLTEPIFAATDILQILFSTLLLLGVVAHWWLGMGRKRPLLRLLWTGSIALACGMLWWRIIMVMPPMNRDLRLYREAAEAGRIDVAEEARSAFEALHPVASGMMEYGALLLALAILAGAASGVQRGKATGQ